MSRLIDVERLCENLDKLYKQAEERGLKDLQKLLLDYITPITVGQPTIDAVERSEYEKMKTRKYIVLQDENGTFHFGDGVVRCKDCKYSKHLKQYPKVNTWKCTLTDVVYRADDFCSYGERRDEDDDI